MPSDTTYFDSIAKPDSTYGINNEMAIPVRHTNIKLVKVQKPLEKLFNPNPIVDGVSSWQIIILVATVLLMAFAKAFSNNRFSQGVKALFSYAVAQEITREEKVFFHRANIFFTIIHLLTSSLFLLQLKELASLEDEVFQSFNSFLLIFTFFSGMYLLKYLSSKLIFFIFNDVNIGPEYIFNVSLYNNLLGIILIPLLCMTYFTSIPFHFILLYIALPLIFIVFGFRLFRILVIGQLKGVSYFYIFLYICTFEILPLVVLFRILILK